MLLAALALAGCGGSDPQPESAGPVASPAAEEPAAAASDAPAEPGPADPPPYTHPPPAWIETARGRFWLGNGGGCWGVEIGCGDVEPPGCGAEGVPEIVLDAGELARVHLEFTPSRLLLEVWPPEGFQAGNPQEQALDASADPELPAPSADSTVFLTADAAEGSASYSACVRIR